MNAPDVIQPRRPVWVPLFLALVTLVAFGNLAMAEFSYLDDNVNLFENPRLNPPTWEALKYYWTHQEQGLYIPLTYTCWAFLAVIGRVSPDPMGITLNPWVFHSANIGLHVLSVLGVYAILSRLFSDRRAACLGALVFALHPVQVEPVAWAAGLKDVLAGLLGIVAVWQYIIWAQWQKDEGGRMKDEKGRAGNSSYMLATIAFVLAMLAKPSALVVPVIAGIVDVGLLGRKLRNVVVALLPWLAFSVICAMVGRLAQPATGIPPAPLWARPLVMMDALAFYLYKLVFPFSLGVDYGRKPAYVMGQWWFYAIWIIPLALGILLFINRNRWRDFLVAGLIFVAGVAPVLGLVTFLYQYRSTTADHYLYLAMLGPALAVAALMKRFNRAPATLVASILLLMLATMTILQTRVWADDLRLFEHALKVNPRSTLSLHNLAHAHAIRGRPASAVPLLEQAIALDPTYAESYEYLAAILKGLGRSTDALDYRIKAVKLVEARPPQLQDSLTAQYVSVGMDLMDAGRLDEAREMLRKALNRTPDDPGAVESLRMVESKMNPPATTLPQ